MFDLPMNNKLPDMDFQRRASYSAWSNQHHNYNSQQPLGYSAWARNRHAYNKKPWPMMGGQGFMPAHMTPQQLAMQQFQKYLFKPTIMEP